MWGCRPRHAEAIPMVVMAEAIPMVVMAEAIPMVVMAEAIPIVMAEAIPMVSWRKSPSHYKWRDLIHGIHVMKC